MAVKVQYLDMQVGAAVVYVFGCILLEEHAKQRAQGCGMPQQHHCPLASCGARVPRACAPQDRFEGDMRTVEFLMRAAAWLHPKFEFGAFARAREHLCGVHGCLRMRARGGGWSRLTVLASASACARRVPAAWIMQDARVELERELDFVNEVGPNVLAPRVQCAHGRSTRARALTLGAGSEWRAVSGGPARGPQRARA